MKNQGAKSVDMRPFAAFRFQGEILRRMPPKSAEKEVRSSCFAKE